MFFEILTVKSEVVQVLSIWINRFLEQRVKDRGSLKLNHDTVDGTTFLSEQVKFWYSIGPKVKSPKNENWVCFYVR